MTLKLKPFIYFLPVLVLSTVSCNHSIGFFNQVTVLSEIPQRTTNLEQYRPAFHFTPEHFWMNDPNGLVYNNGYYHLFYQHYPKSTVWGPMHWGHARSKDLIHWERLPIALFPDDNGWIFSGSAVVDKNNTAGFGENALVAIFTYHNSDIENSGSNEFQYQGIAYSLNNGETWIKYSKNPVLENPGIRDFRDPKVFWNENRDQWQMLLAAGDEIQFFGSKDLKNWTKLSAFKDTFETQLGVWECPDMFQLKVKGSNQKKWVLVISHGSGVPNGGSGTRYFVGDFDGVQFSTNQAKNKWLDFGRDNYAGVTFNGIEDDRRIFIGWMSNWDYATTTPTKNWRSATTLPRELELVYSNGDYILSSSPIAELESLRIDSYKVENFRGKELIFGDGVQQHRVKFKISAKHKNFSFQFKNDSNEAVHFEFDSKKAELRFDRSKSGSVDFNPKFINSLRQQIELPVNSDEIEFDIILDTASIEVFINEGVAVSTNQVYPSLPYNRIEFDLQESQSVTNVEIQTLKSIW